MNNTDNAARTGATVYLNGTRIDCSHKGRPSVTGAIRVESIINSHAALVEALEITVSRFEWLAKHNATASQAPWIDCSLREARAALALAKGGQQ